MSKDMPLEMWITCCRRWFRSAVRKWRNKRREVQATTSELSPLLLLEDDDEVAPRIDRDDTLLIQNEPRNGHKLPPELWAQILEFSTYTDVARMSRVSRTFLHQVMPLLRFLYIDNEEAIPVATKWFQSFGGGGCVEEVVLDCVFDVTQDSVLRGGSYFAVRPSWTNTLDLELFLSSFSKLKSVFLGHGTGETKHEILRRLNLRGNSESGYSYLHPPPPTQVVSFLSTKDDGNDYKSFLRGLCNAYRKGCISQETMVYGLPSLDNIRGCLRRERCGFCILLFRSFPFSQVAMLNDELDRNYFPSHSGDSCERAHERLLRIYKRPGGLEYLKMHETDLFSNLLLKTKFTWLQDYSQSAITYHPNVIKAMKVLHNLGCDASHVSSEVVSRALSKVPSASFFHNKPTPTRRCITEGAFQTLVRAGFCINNQDLQIVPDSKCFVGFCD